MRRSREQSPVRAATAPPVVFSLIWQVFLIYPILAVICADASTTHTVLGLVATGLFSLVYMLGFASPAVTRGFVLHLERPVGTNWTVSPTRINTDPGDPDNAPHVAVSTWCSVATVVALCVCAVGVLPAAGAIGLVTFLPFLGCFAAAAWPITVSVSSTAVLVACGTALAATTGQAPILLPTFMTIPAALSMIVTRAVVGASAREAHYRKTLGVAAERERLARDLHDVLGHTLTALTIRTQLARAHLHTAPETTAEELDTIEQLTRTALTEMRHTVAGMRVADPEAELARMVESLRAANIAVTVTGTTSDIPQAYATLVAWTVREVGTNIVRHAHATDVRVEIFTSGVRITDNGRGIDPHILGTTAAGGQPAPTHLDADRTPSASHGLTGLIERASAAEATLTVATRHDSRGTDTRGTVAELQWPT